MRSERKFCLLCSTGLLWTLSNYFDILSYCGFVRQLNELKSKLEQLKQLEAAYTGQRGLRDTEPGAQSRPEANGVQSQSPHGRINDAVNSHKATTGVAAAAGAESADDNESSVAASLSPPPRPRPPKNYRYTGCRGRHNCFI